MDRIRAHVRILLPPGDTLLRRLAEWALIAFTLLSAILALAGLTGCDDTGGKLRSGPYTVTRICDGHGCQEDWLNDRVIDLDVILRRRDREVIFDLPDGTRIRATFAFVPRADWPADCYSANRGKTEMEVAHIDTPLTLGGLHFESPVLVGYCMSGEPYYMTLVDAEGPPYPWYCSDDQICLTLMSPL